MTAVLIDGRARAARLRAAVAGQAATFREQAGRAPGLATLAKLFDFMRERDEQLVIAGESTPAAARPHRLNAEAN